MIRSDYLTFGGSEDGDFVNPEETLQFLRDRGFGKSQLSESRRALQERRHDTFAFEAFGSGYCDFCYAQLMGGEFEELHDQRQRCTRCSRSVISSEEAFRDEFERVRINMEAAFGMALNVPPVVKMVNAKEIARYTGESFTPTDFVDPRVLGFFERNGKERALFIESGAPRLAAITTMAHELTHVWQDSNWNMSDIEARYGKQNVLPVSEGMAVWAQVQYLLFVREFGYAERQFAYACLRQDEYGVGFRVFAQRYPLNEDGQPGAESPFGKPLPL
ncbi:MAG: hypothetical protein B7C55_14820 [Actinomycetales bacterium mxb001]|nr:MAG: hypothetical protein B7C55_14820 [Actinomycetales bacterium mxb001]